MIYYFEIVDPYGFEFRSNIVISFPRGDIMVWRDGKIGLRHPAFNTLKNNDYRFIHVYNSPYGTWFIMRNGTWEILE